MVATAMKGVKVANWQTCDKAIIHPKLQNCKAFFFANKLPYNVILSIKSNVDWHFPTLPSSVFNLTHLDGFRSDTCYFPDVYKHKLFYL